jgi:hypothetical protein
MRYHPFRRYESAVLASASAGVAQTLTTDVELPSSTQGALVGLIVRFVATGADAAQDLDLVTVKVFDLAGVTLRGADCDDALLMESIIQSNVVTAAVTAFFNARFFEAPRPFNSGVRIVVTYTPTSGITTELETFHFGILYMAEVPA